VAGQKGGSVSDTFTVYLRGRYDINSQRITCPHCGTDEGFTYYARPINAEALVTCPCGYDWRDKRITGETVHDLYLALTGQPTRTTTVTADGEDFPREPCRECAALKAETTELGLLASAAEDTEREELQARLMASLGAQCQHLADAHLGTDREVAS
jgi:hypothetical protein